MKNILGIIITRQPKYKHKGFDGPVGVRKYLYTDFASTPRNALRAAHARLGQLVQALAVRESWLGLIIIGRILILWKLLLPTPHLLLGARIRLSTSQKPTYGRMLRRCAISVLIYRLAASGTKS